MEDLGNLRFKICPHCGKPIRPKIGEKIWREPDVILDPMAGTSSTGIIASLLGRHSVCVELEQKFCEWSRRNVECLEKAGKKRGEIRIIQGDARRLSQLLKGVGFEPTTAITSPPHGDTYLGGGDPEKRKERLLKAGHDPKEFLGGRARNAVIKHYDEVDVCITSPPYSDAISKQGGPVGVRNVGISTITAREYSQNPENIGNLPLGEVSTIITSPPYSSTKMTKKQDEFFEQMVKTVLPGRDVEKIKRRYKSDYDSKENIGNLSHGNIDAVITSPPYVETITQGGTTKCYKEKYGYQQEENKGYSESKENIGNLPLGEISTIITSPPYANQEVGKGIRPNRWEKIKDKEGFKGRKEWKTGTPSHYSDNKENIGNLPLGNVDSVITSPPYKTEMRGSGLNKDDKGLELGCKWNGYSTNPDNIDNLPLGNIDTVITSPPYENAVHCRGHSELQERLTQEKSLFMDEYGGSKGNIGNLKTETCLSDLTELLEIIDSKPYKSVEEVYSVWFTIKRYTNVTTSFIKKKSEPRKGSGCGFIEKLTLAKIVENHVRSQLKDAEGVIVYGGKAWGYIYQKKQEEKLVRQTSAHGQLQGNLRLLPIEGDLSPSLAVLTRLFGREDTQDGEEKDSTLQELDSSTLLVLNANYAELKQNTRIFTMLSRLQKAVKIPKTTLLFYVISAIVQLRTSSTHDGSQNLEPYAKYLALASQLWRLLNPSKPTYLSEMYKVYMEMFKVLKPNGLAIIIVKPFIRNRKVVDLPWHTWLLMAKVGFKLEKLYKLRLKQQSFWRILQYRKFPDIERICHEYVIIARK
jgi:DNA modification methylase